MTCFSWVWKKVKQSTFFMPSPPLICVFCTTSITKLICDLLLSGFWQSLFQSPTSSYHLVSVSLLVCFEETIKTVKSKTELPVKRKSQNINHVSERDIIWNLLVKGQESSLYRNDLWFTHSPKVQSQKTKYVQFFLLWQIFHCEQLNEKKLRIFFIPKCIEHPES